MQPRGQLPKALRLGGQVGGFFIAFAHHLRFGGVLGLQVLCQRVVAGGQVLGLGGVGGQLGIKIVHTAVLPAPVSVTTFQFAFKLGHHPALVLQGQSFGQLHPSGVLLLPHSCQALHQLVGAGKVGGVGIGWLGR